jgi:hypothetical protein
MSFRTRSQALQDHYGQDPDGLASVIVHGFMRDRLEELPTLMATSLQG